MSNYNYSSYIPTPPQIGIGNDRKFSSNVNRTNVYKNILNTGTGNVSDTHYNAVPLGNAYFLDLGVQCKDASGNNQDRQAYINNYPTGKGPISGLGLIPGIIENIEALNPSAIIAALAAKGPPTCIPANLLTTGADGNPTYSSGYVLDSDLKNVDACWFENKTNPASGEKCVWSSDWETVFKNNGGVKKVPPPPKLAEGFAVRKDGTETIYIAGCSLLLLYLISRFLR